MIHITFAQLRSLACRRWSGQLPITFRRLPMLALACLAACWPAPQPNNLPSDHTPPGFVEIRAEYVRVSDGLNTGSEIIPQTGFTRANIPRDRRIVLSVVATDGESGIVPIQLASGDMHWTCTNADGQLATSQNPVIADVRSDEERAQSVPLGLASMRTAHFTLDPFAHNPLRLVCAANQDASPLTVRLTVVVSNGAGAKVVTGPLEFRYLTRPATP